MTQHLADELKALVAEHPEPSEDELMRPTWQLDRISRFYEDKAIGAPEKQAVMFVGFVSALSYALGTVRKYRKLTKRLAELVKEDEVK